MVDTFEGLASLRGRVEERQERTPSPSERYDRLSCPEPPRARHPREVGGRTARAPSLKPWEDPKELPDHGCAHSNIYDRIVSNQADATAPSPIPGNRSRTCRFPHNQAPFRGGAKRIRTADRTRESAGNGGCGFAGRASPTRSRPRPDGIYATLDRTAIGIVQAAGRLRLSIPDDLLVAAVTDSPLLAASNQPVTALDLDAPRSGAPRPAPDRAALAPRW